MDSHRLLVNLIAGRGYTRVLMIVDCRASQASLRLIIPVRRFSAHLFATVNIFWNCSSKFPSGAKNTPRVSYAWCGSSHLITFLVLAISWTVNSPGESCIPAYLQEDLDQMKLTNHHTVFSGTIAPHVALRLNSQVSIAACNCLLAFFGSSWRVDWIMSVSSTKA